MERVDVAVIGGGPAGAFAAQHSASNGAKTVLFEKGVPREDRKTIGPDSTDAAGILDYWVDLMGLDPSTFPEGILLRHLDCAEFISPSESVCLYKTGIKSSYPHFGYTYDRTKFDDWMLENATIAGADCRIGDTVKEVIASKNGPHELLLRNGDSILATNLILSDGPQRSITLNLLNQFLPQGVAEAALGTTVANHIAYQEYREMPMDLFEPNKIKFWWGYMPGHTAYPWIFPNDGNTARIGVTMPIGMDINSISNRDSYLLLNSDDKQIPRCSEYIERLLSSVFPDCDLSDFPIVEKRGKRKGTETYPISSTRPIDSPVHANIAITGGAMGATSAFHEGGAHVALRTGKIAGELAAKGKLVHYNDHWKAAIGDEIRRNVAFANLVRGFKPSDWDSVFKITNRVIESKKTNSIFSVLRNAGMSGVRLLATYKKEKFALRNDNYVQIRETDYSSSPINS